MYAIANLSLKQLCQGMALRVSDPEQLWYSLHKDSAFGVDFFLPIIEREYGTRLQGNAEMIKNEMNDIRSKLEREFGIFQETTKNYVCDLKKELSDKTLENESLREDFSHTIDRIQTQIKTAHNLELVSTRLKLVLEYD